MRIRLIPMLVFILVIMGGSAIMSADPHASRIKSAIVIATDASMPPMEMVDSENTIVGFEIDFIRAVAKEEGFEVEIRNIPWLDLLSGLERGEFDAVISTVTITKKRMKRFDFSVPYINIGQVLAVPVEMKDVTELADMKGMKIGAANGSIGLSEVNRASEVVIKDYDEISHAFKDMAAGKIQGVVCDYLTAARFIFRNEIYLNRFRLAGPPFTRQDCGIVVRKGNTDILEQINKGILAVESKGITADLERKWLCNQQP